MTSPGASDAAAERANRTQNGAGCSTHNAAGSRKC